jgi:hypothetical protein
MEVKKMMVNEVLSQIEAAHIDGVCFFCGSYADSVAEHETRVHGSNRIRQNEVY